MVSSTGHFRSAWRCRNTNFVVDLALNSSAPLLVATASITAIFFALVVVVWLRKGKPVSAVLALVTVSAAVPTVLQMQNILQTPTDPFQSFPYSLWISLGATIGCAIAALLLWFISGEELYNPEITPIKNGISLSACFSQPSRSTFLPHGARGSAGP